MSAFRHAVSLGIPFELDIQLARDGLLVVVHDANLARLTGQELSVSDIDRDQLGRLRIGSSGEHIPVLNQVLEEVNGDVPILLDVRRWQAGFSSDLEHTVAATIRGYPGPLALQSFDPLAVSRMGRLIGDHPVGQVSGNLGSAGRLVATIGRSMVTNIITRPDFVNYELSALPSPYAAFWRRRRPLITWTVRSPEDEERAATVADNFLFDSYLPATYQSKSPYPNNRK
jgi:glycerophosphoryl diester phosphodiesterase